MSVEDYKSQKASFQSKGRSYVLNDKISAAISCCSTVEQQAYRLLYEINAGLQIQAKVNEIPLYALPLVLLLLQNEHGVVKELLQLFIGVVNTQLLKGVQLMKKKVETDLNSCFEDTPTILLAQKITSIVQEFKLVFCVGWTALCQ